MKKHKTRQPNSPSPRTLKFVIVTPTAAQGYDDIWNVRTNGIAKFLFRGPGGLRWYVSPTLLVLATTRSQVHRWRPGVGRTNAYKCHAEIITEYASDLSKCDTTGWAGETCTRALHSGRLTPAAAKIPMSADRDEYGHAPYDYTGIRLCSGRTRDDNHLMSAWPTRMITILRQNGP